MLRIEAEFWDYISAVMGGKWDAQRHEDKYSVGIPDVSYGLLGVNGWIELKAYRKWPTNGIPKFTSKQSNWLKNRGKHGGKCFVLIRIDDYILVYDHVDCHKLRDKGCGKEELKKLAIKYWAGVFVPKEFMEILAGGKLF